MRWVRFVDRFPKPPERQELVCCHGGQRPIRYNWFLDKQKFTSDKNFYWLEGFHIPPYPKADAEPHTGDHHDDSSHHRAQPA